MQRGQLRIALQGNAAGLVGGKPKRPTMTKRTTGDVRKSVVRGMIGCKCKIIEFNVVGAGYVSRILVLHSAVEPLRLTAERRAKVPRLDPRSQW